MPLPNTGFSNFGLAAGMPSLSPYGIVTLPAVANLNRSFLNRQPDTGVRAPEMAAPTGLGATGPTGLTPAFLGGATGGNTGITSSIAQSAGGPAVTDQRVLRALQNNPNATPEQITSTMGQYGIGQGQYDRVAQSMNPQVGGVPMPQPASGAAQAQPPANALQALQIAQAWSSANPNTSIGINPQGQYQGPEGLRSYYEQGAAQSSGVGAMLGNVPYSPIPTSAPQAQQPGGQTAAGLQAQQPHGLEGAEQATLIGARLGLQNLGGTQSQVENIFGRGAQNLQPFQQQGSQAYDLQASLSGAMGPEAQAQAYQQFQRSPGQQFLQQEGERALLRNAAAIGGLGGGNVRRSLLEYGQGLAQQDFANQFDRLGQLSSAGLNAANIGAQLQGQQAGIQANLGQYGAQIPVQTGTAIAQNRFQTGRDITAARADASTALANLMSQQGAGTSDIIGASADRLGQLYQMATQGDVAAREQLGVALANLAGQQGSQYGQQQFTPMQPPSMLGQVGGLASGLGTMLQYTPNKYDYTVDDGTTTPNYVMQSSANRFPPRVPYGPPTSPVSPFDPGATIGSNLQFMPGVTTQSLLPQQPF
jgi:hypothetical protein